MSSPSRRDARGIGGRAERMMFIRDLEVACSIGVYRHERGAGQPVRIDLELTVCDERPIGDSIANVISYDDIVAGVRAVATAGHINLVETLAERIGDFCLSDGRVIAARVRVEKLAALAGVGGVGVVIERIKEGR